MTDLPASKPVDLKTILATPARVDNSEGMSYLQSLPRRLVTLYLPLSIIIIILLFPFYWMGLTSVKPDDQLLDLDRFNPFWTWNPTFKHIHKLLFESYYPHWLWNTMYVAVCATMLSIFASVLAAYAIVRLRYRGDAFELTVTDDGSGVGDSGPNADGHGLLGMRERVALFGGTLETGARSDGPGYMVHAVLPL